MNAASAEPRLSMGAPRARLGRLAGALLLNVGDEYTLIGNLKRPCDFAAAGFVPPAQPIDALTSPVLPLVVAGTPATVGPMLDLGPCPTATTLALAGQIADRLLIARNGSVSDRLWRLLLSDDGDPDSDPPPAAAVVDTAWLIAMPAHLWNIVREAVLKCS